MMAGGLHAWQGSLPASLAMARAACLVMARVDCLVMARAACLVMARAACLVMARAACLVMARAAWLPASLPGKWWREVGAIRRVGRAAAMLITGIV